VTALLPRIVKKELSTQSALAIWCSRSSDIFRIKAFQLVVVSRIALSEA
jgi:hypothetical protein